MNAPIMLNMMFVHLKKIYMFPELLIFQEKE